MRDNIRLKDGFACIQDLVTHAEGPQAKVLQKQAARAAISNAVYTGKGNYTFDRYINTHKEAHTELDRLEEPVPETQKVTDFMDGIQY